MTNVTERIKEGAAKAIQYLENGDSVRRACQKAGISVTSLYHSTTPEQREQAYLKNTSPATNRVASSRGPRRRKVRKQQTLSSGSSDVAELQRQIQDLNDYIVKLEHKLVKAVVLNDNSH
jgi:hypothetical protein